MKFYGSTKMKALKAELLWMTQRGSLGSLPFGLLL